MAIGDLSKPILVCVSGGGMPQIENALGIIKAIRAVHYRKFDRMMGTSAGAIASAVCMSYDQDIDKFDATIRGSKTSDWFEIKLWQGIKSIFGKSNYLADNTKFKNFLLNTITADAVKKIDVAVTDMGVIGGREQCAKGALVDGQPGHVLASMSFQGVFPPVVWDGHVWADGGVYNLCPLPPITEFEKYAHIYIILAATAPLFPTIKWWRFGDKILNVIDRTMEREVSQIRELQLDKLPNVTVFQPDAWTKSANFLSWSEKFEQVDASYEYALTVLKKENK